MARRNNTVKGRIYNTARQDISDKTDKNLIERVRRRLLSNADIYKNINKDNMYDCIKSVVVNDECSRYLVETKTEQVVTDIYNAVCKYDVLQELLDNDDITEIMVNGYKDIFVEKRGNVVKTKVVFESEEKLRDIIQKMVSDVNRVVNESNPIVDARLPDGSRINVVLPPVAIDGPMLTIRKFFKESIDLKDLVRNQTISKEASDMMVNLVKARYNIFIAGGTSSGKTTFLNALSKYIPHDERIVTIEDSAELKLNDIPNLVRLEVRNANMEGKNKITIRELVKTALRMRPNRIIIGEIRGEEALELLDAYNTGHEGSISTGHANSCQDMFSRFESMVMMGSEMPVGVIREKIASSIDIIVYLGRVRDKTRKVLEISEVKGISKGKILLNKLYEFRENTENIDNNIVKGRLIKVNDIICKDKFVKAGIRL